MEVQQETVIGLFLESGALLAGPKDTDLHCMPVDKSNSYVQHKRNTNFDFRKNILTYYSKSSVCFFF